MAADLTKTEQVLAVLKTGGTTHVSPGGRCRVLRDKDGNEVKAWQNAIKSAERIHKATLSATKEHSMQVLNLALRIADANVRSDIECYAYWKEHGRHNLYDTSKPCEDEKATPAERAEHLQLATDALRYIELRGDAFPWRLVRDGSFPNIVHFEEQS